MINIEQLINEYSNSIKIRRDDEYVFVAPPFYHVGSDESIALRFSETEDGRPIISDCGTTKEYLELMGVNVENYRNKLNAIKKRFFIEEDNGAFIMTMPTDSINTVKMHLGYFIQAISIIANID